jgi:hypothetical protein
MFDYLYVLFACIAGAWQAWCLNYGRDNVLAVFLMILLGFPFALASYVHASWLSSTDEIPERPNWKGLVVLWAGMPLSFAAGALTILAQTGIMYIALHRMNDLPLDSLRLLIGESVACLLWAKCLLLWLRQQGLHHSLRQFLALFGALLVGVLVAYGLTILIVRSSQRDHYWLFTSIATTAMSALCLVVLRNRFQHAIGKETSVV